jgi:hypothetical protein
MIDYKIIFISVITSAALLITGCGRDKIEAGSPEEVLSFIKEKGNSESVFDFYTDDTISFMKKYMKITGMKSETSADILSFIPEGAEYNISGKKIEGDKCSLNLTFTKHGSENAMGQIVPVRMIKEGKSWKIDRKDDFKKLIESYEKKGAEGYLNRIK